MEKQIIYDEINRIVEIMIKNDTFLISESFLPSLIRREIESMTKQDIYQMAKKGMERQVKKILRKELTQLSRNEMINLVSKLNFKILGRELTFKIPQLSYQQRTPHYDRIISNILSKSDQIKEYLNQKNNKILTADVLQRVTQSTDPLVKRLDKSLGEIFLEDFNAYFKQKFPNEWGKIEKGIVMSSEQKISEKISMWGHALENTKLTPKERLLLTDKLWFREMRAHLLDFLTGVQKKRDELFSRLDETLESLVYDIMKDSTIDIAKYKNVNVLLENILKTKKESIDGVYYVIQKELSNRNIPFEKISVIMQNLKKGHPFKNYPSWLEEFVNKSYLVRIFTGAKDLNFGQRANNFAQRIAMFGTVGNARKLSEYYEQFIKGEGKYKWVGGVIWIYAYLEFLSKVVYPAFIALCYTFYIQLSRESKTNPMTWGERYWDKLNKIWNQIFIVQKGDFAEQHKFLGIKMSEGDLDLYKTFNPTHQWWTSFVYLMDKGNQGGIIDMLENERNRIDSTIQLDNNLRNLRDSINNNVRPVIDSLNKKIDSLKNEVIPQFTPLTVNSIIEKYPCYLKNEKGQVSDVNFGDRGFEIVNDKQFKYKFIDDETVFIVNLGGDNKWRFEDGNELSC